MEREESELGRFILEIKLLQNNMGKLTPKFNSGNINMSNEVLIAQLKNFLSILEDNYRQNFKNNSIDISGSTEDL